MQCYRKPNWNEVWIILKFIVDYEQIHTTCPSAFIVDFEQIIAGWEAKGGGKKQVRSTKISLDIVIETMFALLLYLLIENIKLEKYCFERNNSTWCFNGYDFELYQCKE